MEDSDPDPALLEAAMQVPITVCLGPVGALLRKLDPEQGPPPDLLSPGEIRLLKVLCISLKDMSEDEDPSFIVQWWMKMVRELCYDTDDHLDQLSGAGAGAHLDFSGLRARAEYASERHKCLKWSPPKTIKPAGVSGLSFLGGRSTACVVEHQKKLVELLSLDDDENTLKVIPINGCAGVGKTTVARTLYHQHGGKFKCRAFVTVSRNPYMRGFLTNLLSQVKAPQPHGFPDVSDLIDAIYKHLQGRRYFIVIDDLWTASVWNIIRHAFPHGDSCSRIITTTQIDDVALACCSYYPKDIYKMEPLNDIESRKLFFGRVFGSEDGCPEDIEQVSSKIIRKCDGLPLAIVNIASLLANEFVMEKWKHVHDSLPSYVDMHVQSVSHSVEIKDMHPAKKRKEVKDMHVQSVSQSVRMKDVLNLMYNSLPPRLRTCLLYLSMYAQGYVIKRDELVKHWVVEGFLRVVEGQDMEEIAEGYFDELVCRGMVQAVDINCNGKVLSCSVHQIVLDFIRRKSREENFVITVDYDQSTLALPDKVRRLSVQFGGVKSAYIPESIVTSHVRSLIFWGFFKCVPCIAEYGHLRVLILDIWADRGDESFDLTGIGELFLLKYIKIESNITVKLPDKDKIERLRYLEILEVYGGLSGEDIHVLKGLPSLTALTLCIQAVPKDTIIVGKEGFKVLTYFKFICGAPCLSFVPGAMSNVQKLELGFNSNKLRSHTFGSVGFRHLRGLTEVSVELGVWDAEEVNLKDAESALVTAVRCDMNSPIIRVHHVDVIFCAEEDKSTATEEKEEDRKEIEEDKKKNREHSQEHANKQLVHSSRYARKDGVSTPLQHIAQSVDLVTGAFGSLLPKLLDLLKDHYEGGASLYKELECIQASLRDMAMRDPAQRDQEDMIWAKQARDLSYEAEDQIDLGQASKRPLYEYINDIINNVQDLTIRRKWYKADDRIVAANPNASANVDPCLLDLYKPSEDLFGIHGPVEEVIRKLKGKDSGKLRIVSIVGMAGSGKTTLANAVAKTMEDLHTVFVSASKDSGVTTVLMDILLGIDGHQRSIGASWDAKMLIDVFRQRLTGRYLIIIDDLWDVNVGKILKYSLDNGKGCKVIITTRLLDVAINAGGVYHLKGLSHSHSEELFNTKLFGGKNNTPLVVPRVSEKLLQRCGGLPLAIITMASLFAEKQWNYCSNVYTNVSFGSKVGGNRDVDDTRKRLLSSYYNLPYRLRACLLHLHIFPEGYLIKKETLIWKWAAEGLIVEEPGTGFFELGEGYFMELIESNVVIPVEDGSHCGIIIGCRVHCLVLDMICSLSTAEEFVAVVDESKQYCPAESNARRLAIQKWTVEQVNPLDNRHKSRLRSFNAMGCCFSTNLFLSSFELLRVIAIEECTLVEGEGYHHLKHLGKLLLLRYLGLYNTRIDELPEEIGDLISLQTLDLRGTNVIQFPWSVAQLRQLKCLRADDSIRVPDWMGNFASLEVLQLGEIGMSENFATELGKLTELRELDIRIEKLDENMSKALVESLGNLHKVRVLRLSMSSLPGEEANWKGFVPPLGLRYLCVKIASSRLPAWINASLVPHLSHLCVEMKALKAQDLEEIGRLPNLISLDLVLLSDVVPTIENGYYYPAFPRLRYFGTSAPVMFQPGAMPCLESFRFKINNRAMMAADIDFDSMATLPMLQKVEVEISCTSDVEEVHEAVKRAVDEHPNRPSLHVIKPDQEGTAHLIKTAVIMSPVELGPPHLYMS